MLLLHMEEVEEEDVVEEEEEEEEEGKGEEDLRFGLSKEEASDGGSV